MKRRIEKRDAMNITYSAQRPANRKMVDMNTTFVFDYSSGQKKVVKGIDGGRHGYRTINKGGKAACAYLPHVGVDNT